MRLCIVTPTGQRKELLGLCCKWVLHQSLQPDLWIILTDTGEQSTGVDLPPFARHISFSKETIASVRTFDPSNRSLALASCFVPDDHATVIMEDDDYYPRDYTSIQLASLTAGAEIAGDRLDHRYHIGTQQHFVRRKPIPNLGCMAFAPGLIRNLQEWLCDPLSSRDYWQRFRCNFDNGALRYSIKGAGYAMPGRKGGTHDPSNPAMAKWQRDTEPYATLRSWLGSDADDYIALCKSA